MLDFLVETGAALITSFMSGVTVFNDFTTYWLGLDGLTRYIVELLQIPSAVGILFSAYVVKLTIKLIPGL